MFSLENTAAFLKRQMFKIKSAMTQIERGSLFFFFLICKYDATNEPRCKNKRDQRVKISTLSFQIPTVDESVMTGSTEREKHRSVTDLGRVGAVHDGNQWIIWGSGGGDLR